MEEKRIIKMLERLGRSFDVQKYREMNFFETHVSFEGTPRKHPSDKTKVILLTDPFSDKKVFFEFPISAIDYVEELETLSSVDGKSAVRMRLWIKKGSVGIRYEPFIV